MTALLSSLPGQKTWPEGIKWEQFRYAMVESPAEVRFLGTSEIRSAMNFHWGVAFGPRAELRWMRRTGRLYHFVYLSDDNLPLLENMPHQRKVAAVEERKPDRLFLWDGSDGRIPHTPVYPHPASQSGKRLAVRIRHYKFNPYGPEALEDNGATSAENFKHADVFLFRCVDLIPGEQP